MKNETPDFKDLAKGVALKEQADLYFYNGPIDDRGYIEILKALSESDNAEKAILLITTFGGQAEPAYRIARFFQRSYKDFIVYPTNACASAGTLLAIGATSLIMSPFSELGPLDVQKTKKDEIGERKSGLISKAALESLQKQSIKFWEEFMLEIKGKSKGGGNI